MIPGFFFELLARFLHEGARNFLPPSLSELALALGAVCLLPPLSPHATCDDGDGDGDDGDGNGEDEVKPRIVSSQLLKEGPVDGKEPTWAFYKCVTYSNKL